MHASYQKERRERIKREKLERKRVYREKVALGRKKIKETAEVAEPMVVDDNEEENEVVMDEPKWNVGDHVVVEDSRVGASRKLFWEVLAVVKSREYVSGEWHYCVDDLDYETKFLYRAYDA